MTFNSCFISGFSFYYIMVLNLNLKIPSMFNFSIFKYFLYDFLVGLIYGLFISSDIILFIYMSIALKNIEACWDFMRRL